MIPLDFSIEVLWGSWSIPCHQARGFLLQRLRAGIDHHCQKNLVLEVLNSAFEIRDLGIKLLQYWDICQATWLLMFHLSGSWRSVSPNQIVNKDIEHSLLLHVLLVCCWHAFLCTNLTKYSDYWPNKICSFKFLKDPKCLIYSPKRIPSLKELTM